jgi:hypothetical protein
MPCAPIRDMPNWCTKSASRNEDAGSDIPILLEEKSEYAQLQWGGPGLTEPWGARASRFQGDY